MDLFVIEGEGGIGDARAEDKATALLGGTAHQLALPANTQLASICLWRRLQVKICRHSNYKISVCYNRTTQHEHSYSLWAENLQKPVTFYWIFSAMWVKTIS